MARRQLRDARGALAPLGLACPRGRARGQSGGAHGRGRRRRSAARRRDGAAAAALRRHRVRGAVVKGPGAAAAGLLVFQAARSRHHDDRTAPLQRPRRGARVPLRVAGHRLHAPDPGQRLDPDWHRPSSRSLSASSSAFPAVEWCIVVLAMAGVWISEALNTAIEAVVDPASPDRHPLAGRAKDVAAGAVRRRRRHRGDLRAGHLRTSAVGPHLPVDVPRPSARAARARSKHGGGVNPRRPRDHGPTPSTERAARQRSTR